jgi:hypothetical protein
MVLCVANYLQKIRGLEMLDNLSPSQEKREEGMEEDL